MSIRNKMEKETLDLEKIHGEPKEKNGTPITEEKWVSFPGQLALLTSGWSGRVCGGGGKIEYTVGGSWETRRGAFSGLSFYRERTSKRRGKKGRWLKGVM